MLSISFLVTFLVAFTGLAATSPIQSRAPAQYKFRTTVINGNHNDTGSNKNNLWVYSYHTGAGLGDACLDKNQTIGEVGFFNDTQLLFKLGEYNYPMGFGYEPYAAWADVSISIAESTTTVGFFLNDTGLHNNYSSNAGWLSCDWYHGVPQLFWTSGYYNDTIPSSCSVVKLDAVSV